METDHVVYESPKEELTLKVFLKNAVNLGFNIFMDIIPITVCYMILLSNSDDLTVSTLTLTIACYFLIFSLSIGFVEAQGIKCSYFFGKKDKSHYSIFFFRIAMIDTILVLLAFIVVLNAKSLLILFQIEPELAGKVESLLKWTFFAKALETYLLQLKGVLTAQKIFDPFFYINLISFTIFILTFMFFIYYLDHKLKGFYFFEN